MAAPAPQAPNRSQYEMLSIAEAQDIILQHSRPLPPQTVDLLGAVGRVLAEDVTARQPLPSFPASIKDGYAVCSTDGLGEYPVVGECRAGNAGQVSVAAGQVAYITTGACVPEGADAVVQVEDTEREAEGATVRILTAANCGQDIRPVGSDIAQGEVVLKKGELIGAAEAGILAAVGAASVSVVGEPIVALMSTGDEVVEPSVAEPGLGQVRDSNRSMLAALAGASRARVVDLGIAIDTEGDLEGCLQRAIDAGAHVLLTSGGVSMGDRDLIKPLLERKGTVHFGRVLMKPGKPLTFATLEMSAGGSLLVFGLPGNPVSSFVTYHLCVAPSLRALRGLEAALPARVHARITQDLRLDPARPEYHRVSLRWEARPEGDGGEFLASSTGAQVSSRLLSAKSANALLELPRAEGVQPAGSVVSALLIGDLSGV